MQQLFKCEIPARELTSETYFSIIDCQCIVSLYREVSSNIAKSYFCQRKIQLQCSKAPAQGPPYQRWPQCPVSRYSDFKTQRNLTGNAQSRLRTATSSQRVRGYRTFPLESVCSEITRRNRSVLFLSRPRQAHANRLHKIRVNTLATVARISLAILRRP